jgi:hypothetical protein
MEIFELLYARISKGSRKIEFSICHTAALRPILSICVITSYKRIRYASFWKTFIPSEYPVSDSNAAGH